IVASFIAVDPVVEFMLHQFRGSVRFQQDARRKIIGVKVAERGRFEGLDKMVENNLRNAPTVWESGDEDWTVEFGSFVEVKFYWLSHGRRGRTGRSILEIGEGSTD